MADQTVLQLLKTRFAAAIQTVAGLDIDPLVAPSGDDKHGDYQCNAAMSLAGRLKKERGEKVNPRELAQQIADAVDLEDVAKAVELAGPGFINIQLAADFVVDHCNAALANEGLAVPAATPRQKVVVEYSSVNIAKEMHVGHVRSTVLGDAIARVMAYLGHKVIRQNHIGDWGTQFGMLIARLEEVGGYENAEIKDLDTFYKQAKQRFDEDADFATKSRETVVRLQRGDSDVRAAWQKFVDVTRDHYETAYDILGVQLCRDDECGESFYNDRLPEMTKELLAGGVAEESEGAIVSFAGGFKAPLMIRKSDGGFCYGTTDLAALEHRAKTLKADRSIYLVDARQSQHFKQIFATYAEAVEKLGWPGNTSPEHAAFGNFLGKDGKPFKTRSGQTAKLADLLGEAIERGRAVIESRNPDLPDDEKAALAKSVGIGGIKYADLSKDRVNDYVFDFDDMLSLAGNTSPYMQYAHARVQSVLRKAEASGQERVDELQTEHEHALGLELMRFGDVVFSVAADLKPHMLCNYLYELARLFSAFYENCPILKSEGKTRQSRIALTALTGRTIATGLGLLGIDAPDRM